MSTAIATPAALAFTEAELGGPCYEVESSPATAAVVAQIVPNNGDRVGLLIVNISGNSTVIGVTSAVGQSKGIPLAAGGGFFSCNVRDDFTLPAREWLSFGNAVASNLYVLEIIRYRSSPYEVS